VQEAGEQSDIPDPQSWSDIPEIAFCLAIPSVCPPLVSSEEPATTTTLPDMLLYAQGSKSVVLLKIKVKTKGQAI
jgi:hypothetical protein